MPRRTYTYAEIADLLEQHFGVRPAISSLRAAAATTKRAQSTSSKPRITAEMPAKLPGDQRPARFDADRIDAWIADHPLARWQAATAAFTAALRTGHDPEQAVAQARSDGLSWDQITLLWNAESDAPRTKTAIHRRFHSNQEQ